MHWTDFRPLALWILEGPRSLLLPTDPKGLSQWYEKRLAIRRVIGPKSTCTISAVYYKAQPLPDDPPAIIRSACCDVPVLQKPPSTEVETSAAIRVKHKFCSQEGLNRLCTMFSALKDITATKVLSRQENVQSYEPGSVVRDLDVASFLFAVDEKSISIKGVFVSSYPVIEQCLQPIEREFENLLIGDPVSVIERYASEPWEEIWDVRSDELADFPSRLMGDT